MNNLNTTPDPYWKFYIDTGGTFTDCLAVDPVGGEHRCKVLSSSALRGSATPVDENKIRVAMDFRVKDNFFAGCQFLLLNEPDQIYRITESDGENSILTLDREIQSPVGESVPFEIRSPEEAPVLAARLLTNTATGEPFPPIRMRLSTTKGTNALLERRGAKSLFLITEGFGDLLKIRNQQRPDLFSLNIQKPQPFYSHIIEVAERLDADGNVIRSLDSEKLKKQLAPLADTFKSAAICLMHSYRNPAHETEVENLLRDLGITRVSRSSGLSSEIKIVPRAVTADVNAYLAPLMENYLEGISGMPGQMELKVMTSAGILANSDHYRPIDGLLSGPAGGVIGAAAIGKRIAKKGLQSPEGEDSCKIISFDMGGTSTDAARYDGKIDYVYEHSVGDATLSAPAVDIETVAAGGGSVCGFDGVSLTAGPESAGADPGPACYGRGGPLTITDVNLLSGRLHPGNFRIPIVTGAAEERLEEILAATASAGKQMSRRQILEGFLEIANERMAQAIRRISIQKGFDPAEYAMVAFGGAGAQHALAVSEKLNINTVLIPSDAGLLSAWGLQQAKTEQIVTRQILKPIGKIEHTLPALFKDAAAEAVAGLKKQNVAEKQISITRRQVFLRLKNQDSSLEIDWNESVNISGEFKKAYISHYGHWIENHEIEVEAIRVKASENFPADDETSKKTIGVSGSELLTSQEISTQFGPVYHSRKLKPGATLTGPALALDPYSTAVIEPGWQGTLLEDGTWLVKRKISEIPDKHMVRKEKDRSEAVNLQLYTNRFRSVADQMGEMLRRTAMSVNVKERFDFSCALLDRDGYLVANAPHIPVHLGAMGTCVRMLIEFSKKTGTGEFEDGDVMITNHPAFGGSHLPDVTVVTPIFFDGERIGFAAGRAHHAEIGGRRPGSMPPDANNLAEEGVVIPPCFIARGGNFDWEPLRQLLENSKWPSRSPGENMADIRAAVAANHRGAGELKKMAALYGPADVSHYMQRLKNYAASRMKSTLKKIPDGNYQAEEKLDDGAVLKVSCQVKNGKVKIDFTGTSGVRPGNLNANPSIVNSVVIYVLRLMIDEPLPLNDGLLEPVELIIPPGMLSPEFPDDPEKCPAVVGGNIETSQRLADTLLKAFGLAACSYGTMNNVLFGNQKFGYYETVAGGTGAGEGFHGADAVHQHMTNTRAADPEILEHRFPVRLDKYSIREGSGGPGKWKGGSGIIREMTFLEPVSLSVLAQHRVVPPYGLKGGKNGKTGRQWIEFKDGTVKKLEWRDGAELGKGERFILHTPGGGGMKPAG